jgi:hypothetical protein
LARRGKGDPVSPIRASERRRYPVNWPAISARIRFARAGGRCECLARHGQPHPVTGSVVVLTTAHLDHVPEHCDDANLRAMCQRCHLAYDAELHAATAATRGNVTGRQASARAAGDDALAGSRRDGAGLDPYAVGAARARELLRGRGAGPETDAGTGRELDEDQAAELGPGTGAGTGPTDSGTGPETCPGTHARAQVSPGRDAAGFPASRPGEVTERREAEVWQNG